MTVEDRSDVDKYLRILEDLCSYEVRVGILSKADGEILMIANVHEYGCNIPVTPKMRGYFLYNFGVDISKDTKVIKIPERSFIRASYDINKSKFSKFDDLFGATLDGKLEVRDFYKIVGAACVDVIKNYIRAGVSPELSSLTKKNKAPKTKPLIDSGRLINAIDYEVIKT